MMFAAQKGASPREVRRLEAALSHFAVITAAAGAPDLATMPGSGAAGGSGLRLALAGAQAPRRRCAHLRCGGTRCGTHRCRAARDHRRRLDAQTATGKAPAEVATRAKNARIPCVAIGGTVFETLPALFTRTLSLGAIDADVDPRLHARALLRAAARRLTHDVLASRGGQSA